MNEHDADFREAVAFLRRSRTANLATVDEHGGPHAANLQYALDDDLNLYFVSSPASAHSRHIARDGRVAMTVYAHDDSPANIHGVQLHGRCAAVHDPQTASRAWDCYLKTFPFIADSPAIKERVAQEQFYTVSIDWLRWIDNRRGFGFKREWTQRG